MVRKVKVATGEALAAKPARGGEKEVIPGVGGWEKLRGTISKNYFLLTLQKENNFEEAQKGGANI